MACRVSAGLFSLMTLGGRPSSDASQQAPDAYSPQFAARRPRGVPDVVNGWGLRCHRADALDETDSRFVRSSAAGRRWKSFPAAPGHV